MMSITQVFDEMKRHLDSHTDHLECFSRRQYQSEGWLKAEWITLLDKLYHKGDIRNVDHEVVAKGRKKIDLTVELGDGKHWIELKHWYIGDQKDGRWRVVDFIDELENECEKFKAIKAGKRAWVVILCTGKPTIEDWSASIKRFNDNNRPLRLISNDNPGDQKSDYFLAIINVGGLD